MDQTADRAARQQACERTFFANREHILRFAERSRAHLPGSSIVVVLNMEDPVAAVLGAALASETDLVPDGQPPFIRGLAERFGVADFLAEIDMAALAKLESLDILPTDYLSAFPVVVIDHGTIAVFPASFCLEAVRCRCGAVAVTQSGVCESCFLSAN